ncbi:MAG: bifunctional phosphoribosylaminoimidazolecarboxamide formyltransferase/IMP cyclohydrolase [Thermoplasmata archaeon]|nr:MAG: bifunctional phosphoribosylaminoimidazolecarboxamide formyltransferase/IMP cyclohydrolase [Thermoplasmata archaeon]
MHPKRAIVSVYDKSGLDELSKALQKHGIEIYATGGTGEYLKKHGIEFKSSEEYTGFVELLDGKVKTLNSKLHAAILGSVEELKKLGIKPIDMVVCNFYPLDFGIEGMDIGGPAMTRAAAKNWKRVVIVSSPSQYKEVIEHLEQGFDEDFRRRLAIEAIRRTAYYDAKLVERYNEEFPNYLTLPFLKKIELRYGENPHQRGAFYVVHGNGKANIANAEQLHGKMLSYNNILDANHAIECVKEFEEPSAVIIKHATPSGIASASSIEKAWKDAFETDIYSPFGGVVAFNREVTPELANELSKIFLEIVIAPSYNSEALEILKRKKNLRILRVEGLDREKRTRGIEVRSVENGLLVQEKDVKEFDPSTWKVVTEKKPSKEDIKSMIFAVKSVRHVKSNAVVFVKGTKTVAIGGGQTARVDATWIAVHKGKDRIKGSIMASDAFFPFRDAVDLAAEHGVRAIVQPGGSIRDNEVIQAANEHGIIMVFTGQRCFLH